MAAEEFKKTIQVIVREPNKKVFEGEVSSLSSINEKGVFDILPYHSNFVATVSEYLIVRFAGNKEKKIEIKTGVLRAKNNLVEIYLGV